MTFVVGLTPFVVFSVEGFSSGFTVKFIIFTASLNLCFRVERQSRRTRSLLSFTPSPSGPTGYRGPRCRRWKRSWGPPSLSRGKKRRVHLPVGTRGPRVVRSPVRFKRDTPRSDGNLSLGLYRTRPGPYTKWSPVDEGRPDASALGRSACVTRSGCSERIPFF